MLLAPQVVLVCILTVVRALARGAHAFKGCFGGSSRSRSLVDEDFLSEYLRGEGRERSNTSLEIVAAGTCSTVSR